MILKNISLIFAIAEAFLFVTQFFNVLLRKQDKSRIRFLILVGSFVIFNLLYALIPEILGSDNFRSRLFLYLSGYLVSAIYLMYVMKEYKLFESITSSKNLMYGVTLTMITCYFTSYFLLGTFEIAKITFLSLPILTSVFTCIYAHLQFVQRREKPQSSFFLLTTYFGIVLMASLPLVIHFNVCIEINISMINLPFMLLAAGYFYQHSQNNKREFEALTNIGYFSDVSVLENYNLTRREIQIAKLILEEKSFKEIADTLSISTRTATKHASNLYPKVGCKTKEEFIKRYRKVN